MKDAELDQSQYSNPFYRFDMPAEYSSSNNNAEYNFDLTRPQNVLPIINENNSFNPAQDSVLMDGYMGNNLSSEIPPKQRIDMLKKENEYLQKRLELNQNLINILQSKASFKPCSHQEYQLNNEMMSEVQSDGCFQTDRYFDLEQEGNWAYSIPKPLSLSWSWPLLKLIPLFQQVRIAFE